MSKQFVNSSEQTAGLFGATQWSVVLRAKEDSVSALNTLFNAYRKPLLRLAAAKGIPASDQEDVVQGFLEALCRRQFLKGIDPELGRFRTFLCKAFTRYLNDLNDKAQAEKRGKGKAPVSLQETDDEGLLLVDPPSSEPTADVEFDRAWAEVVLADSMRQLEEECVRSGHRLLWKELEPVLYKDTTADSYSQIGARLKMSEGAVKTAVSRIRGRLKWIIREKVAQTVASVQDCNEELTYLLSLFARP